MEEVRKKIGLYHFYEHIYNELSTSKFIETESRLGALPRNGGLGSDYLGVLGILGEDIVLKLERATCFTTCEHIIEICTLKWLIVFYVCSPQ